MTNHIVNGRFFYIIVQTFKCPMCPYVHMRVGFGVTSSVYDRIDDYMAHTFGLQEFKYLFYGPSDEINIIEEEYKKLKRPYLLTISRRKGKWKIEGLDSEKCSDTAEDVRDWVLEFIKNKPVWQTRILKKDWLPYRGSDKVQKAYIANSPDEYLEDPT